MVRHGLIKDFDVLSFDVEQKRKLPCEAWLKGKMHRHMFGQESQRIPQRIHWIDYSLISVGTVNVNLKSPLLNQLFMEYGESYLGLGIDDYSRKHFIFPARKKGEFADELEKFILRMKTKLERKLKEFITDGGTEVASKEFKLYLQRNGTEHLRTNCNTPNSNAPAERGFRTEFEFGKSNLFHAKLSSIFWSYAIMKRELCNKYVARSYKEIKS